MIENQGTIQKIGFHIGWDYYVYSATLPPHASEYQDIVKGYQEAASRAHQRKSDRYERKCLQLRLNAYTRGKAFDENITPDYLKQIDTPTCPITKVTLTHGSGAETDWSVDRIHNDSGYTVGNLVIVSSKANKAKGSMSYDQILSIIDTLRVSPENDYGLNLFEWIRWQSICAKVIPFAAVKNNAKYRKNSVEDAEFSETGFVFTFAPCVIFPPNGIFTLLSDVMQILIAYRSAGLREAKLVQQDLMQYFDAKGRADLLQIMKTAQKVFDRMRSPNMLDIWFNQNLFDKFQNFYMKYCLENEQIQDFLLVTARKLPETKSGSLLKNLDFKAWHVDTKGYNSRNSENG